MQLLFSVFLWDQGILWAQGGDLFDSAIRDFQGGNYSGALSVFRQLLLDPLYAEYHGDAYFWVTKTLLAGNRIADAERNLEFFLSNFPDNKNYPEGVYHRGRILFLNASYEAAIVALSDFISQYPENPFIANAYYWAGEALFNLGQFDQAEKMFLAVINEFPASYRVEAARYRMAVLDLSRREEELIRLLQWTQEESIQDIEDFRKRELEYQEAISSLQAGTGTGVIPSGLVSEEKNKLEDENARLQAEKSLLTIQFAKQRDIIRNLENEIRSLRNTSASDSSSSGAGAKVIQSTDVDFQQRLDLIALKEESLSLKASLIERLEKVVLEYEEDQ